MPLMSGASTTCLAHPPVIHYRHKRFAYSSYTSLTVVSHKAFNNWWWALGVKFQPLAVWNKKSDGRHRFTTSLADPLQLSRTEPCNDPILRRLVPCPPLPPWRNHTGDEGWLVKFRGIQLLLAESWNASTLRGPLLESYPPLHDVHWG